MDMALLVAVLSAPIDVPAGVPAKARPLDGITPELESHPPAGLSYVLSHEAHRRLQTSNLGNDCWTGCSASQGTCTSFCGAQGIARYASNPRLWMHMLIWCFESH